MSSISTRGALRATSEGRTSRLGRWRSSALLSAVAVSVVAFALPGAVSATTGNKVVKNCTSANGFKVKNNPLVCQGLAFYKGKTINMVVAGSVGGSADSQARAQASYVAKYLGANIAPTNISGSNGVQGMNYTAHATADGLTMGTLNLATTLLAQLEGNTSVNFNASRLGWISENASTTNVIIGQANSQCTSIAAMKVANPPCSVLASTTGIAPLQGALLFGLLGIPVKWLNVYSSSNAVTVGFARHDGPLMVGNLTSSGQFLQSKQAVTVANALKVPVGTQFRAYVDTAPTFTQLLNGIKTKNKTKLAQIAAFKQLILDGNSPIVTQSGVPAYKLEALRAAFNWMAKTPSIGAAMAAVAATPNFITGQEAKSGWIKVQNNLKYFQPLAAVLFH